MIRIISTYGTKSVIAIAIVSSILFFAMSEAHAVSEVDGITPYGIPVPAIHKGLESVTGEQCIFPLPKATSADTYYWLDKEFAYLDNESIRYDMAAPRTEGKYPLVLLVHGGAFQVGDKTEKFPEETVRSIAAQGYAVATLDYGLATSSEDAVGGQNHFPRAIQDLRCAVKYFRSNTDNQLRFVDTEHIGVVGTSAGGHLGLLLGTAEHVEEFDDPDCPYNEFSSEVQSVAAFFPSTRFRPQAEEEEWENYSNVRVTHDEYVIFGTQLNNVLDLVKKGSPLYHAQSYNPKDPLAIPPIMIVNSGREKNPALTTSAVLLDKALNEAALPHIFFTEENAYHGFGPFTDFSESSCKTMQFLDATLRGGTDSSQAVKSLKSINPATDQVHAIGVRRASVTARNTCEQKWSRITVNVSDKFDDGTGVVLALSSFEPVIWDIKNPGNVNLKEIQLSGYYTQHVEGDIDRVTIEHHTNFNLDRVTATNESGSNLFRNLQNTAWPSRFYYDTCNVSAIDASDRSYFVPDYEKDYAISYNKNISDHYKSKIKSWTGMNVSSYQGAYTGRSFTISPSNVKGASANPYDALIQQIKNINSFIKAKFLK